MPIQCEYILLSLRWRCRDNENYLFFKHLSLFNKVLLVLLFGMTSLACDSSLQNRLNISINPNDLSLGLMLMTLQILMQMPLQIFVSLQIVSYLMFTVEQLWVQELHLHLTLKTEPPPSQGKSLFSPQHLKSPTLFCQIWSKVVQIITHIQCCLVNNKQRQKLLEIVFKP